MSFINYIEKQNRRSAFTIVGPAPWRESNEHNPRHLTPYSNFARPR